jgi:hypothetical protein
LDEEGRGAIRDTMRFLEVDRPTYSYTLPEAIADGHLVPYEIYRAMTVARRPPRVSPLPEPKSTGRRSTTRLAPSWKPYLPSTIR